jgi:hypothetical protein
VLGGAAELLRREDAPALCIEFADATGRTAGQSCEQLYRALQGFGYRMFTYARGRKRLVHEALRGSYLYENLIAAKPSSRFDPKERGFGCIQ